MDTGRTCERGRIEQEALDFHIKSTEKQAVQNRSSTSKYKIMLSSYITINITTNMLNEF